MPISKEDLIDLHSGVIALSQDLLRMYTNIDGEDVRDPHGAVETHIGIFLAKLIEIGARGRLNEEQIRFVVKDMLNANTLDNSAVDFQRYSATVTQAQRDRVTPMFLFMYGAGIDLPDYVSADSTYGANLSLLWRGNGQPGRRQNSVEIILTPNGFDITAWESSRPFNKVTKHETAMSLLEDREFFVKYGLGVEAVLADRFNPLRIFNK